MTAVVLLVCSFVGVGAVLAQEAFSTDSLEIRFVDVGQGDAAVYRGTCGEIGVIDVASGGAESVAEEIRSMGGETVKWLSASHYDADHIGGIVQLADEFAIETVYDRGGGREAKDKPTYHRYYDWAEGTGNHTGVEIGSTFSLCSGEDEVVFEVVSVGTDGTAAAGVAVRDENDRSVCLVIRFRFFREFTCGDASGRSRGNQRDIETAMGPIVGLVDLLKVSHHGSKSSSNAAFVRALCPSVSVISVGKNGYGHPDGQVRDRLRDCGGVYQTEDDRGNRRAGTIVVTTDGNDTMLVTTERDSVGQEYELLGATSESGEGEGRVPVSADMAPDAAVILVCLAYGIGVWLLQLHRVVPPRDWLLQRISDLRTRANTEDWKDPAEVAKNLEGLRRWIDKPWFLVPTSRVQAGWRQVHSIEDAHVIELPEAAVDEQLETMRIRLDAISSDEAKSLKKRIDSALREHDDGSKEPTLPQKRALLQQASILRHNDRDSDHEDLASLLAKGVWLTILSLALIVALAILFGRESFFLMGTAGALVSRLTRVLRQRPKANDYGAGWSTLILSPAAGALAGWLGVLLVVALAGDPLNVLDDRFGELWDDPTDVLGLVTAFVFGFSERLFDRLLETTTTQFGKTLPKEPADKDEDERTGSSPRSPRRARPQPARPTPRDAPGSDTS